MPTLQSPIAPLTVNGNFLQVPATGGIDTNAAGTLNIGTVNATGITIGKGAFNVNILGGIQIGGGQNIDATGTMFIGQTTATTISIGRAAQTINITSPTLALQTTGNLNFNFNATAAGTGGAPTLPANTPTGAAGGAGKWVQCQLLGVACWALVWQ